MFEGFLDTNSDNRVIPTVLMDLNWRDQILDLNRTARGTLAANGGTVNYRNMAFLDKSVGRKTAEKW